MASISTELGIIESAILGKDMRQAIHDALEKLAKDVTTSLDAVYQTLTEVQEQQPWAYEVVCKCVEHKYLSVDSENPDKFKVPLTYDILRILYLLDHQGIWDVADSLSIQSMSDVPDYGKPTLQKLINAGLFKGISGYSSYLESGDYDDIVLGIGVDVVRLLVVLDRAGVFDLNNICPFTPGDESLEVVYDETSATVRRRYVPDVGSVYYTFNGTSATPSSISKNIFISPSEELPPGWGSYLGKTMYGALELTDGTFRTDNGYIRFAIDAQCDGTWTTILSIKHDEESTFVVPADATRLRFRLVVGANETYENITVTPIVYSGLPLPAQILALTNAEIDEVCV